MNSNNIISKKTAILLGVSGVLGSFVLFAGDMLFYYKGSQTDIIANMASSSDERIILSGACALIAGWLYIFASGQIYYAFQPAKKWIRLTLFATFAMIMISYAVIHGAYVAIATSAKNAVEVGMNPDLFTALAISANDLLRNITYFPFGIFTLLFIPTVWMKKTYYPRWIIFFSPVIPFLLNDTIVKNLKGGLKIIIGGGYLNLILSVFFTASTLALWLGTQKDEELEVE